MRFLILTVCVFFGLNGFSQNKPYFQQKVDYTIDVTLDDVAHTLSGNVSFDYHNQSPDTLREIQLHLWGNAYKDQSTAFAKQQLRVGKTDFFYEQKKYKGYFEGFDWKVNTQKADFAFQKGNVDIGKIVLAQPLLPGQKITVSTPFVLHIPEMLSRLGHKGQAYQITQWFPKPAVYDANGWQAMPYLDMGEFYSEFGTFDVSLTLPANYKVAATGVLQNPSEIAFRDSVITASAMLLADMDNIETAIPKDVPSAATMKTIRYTAENVHDFAWFADKRYLITKEMASLSNGKFVETFGFFYPEGAKIWNQSAFYTKRAVEFYSTKVGNYVWPHASAVEAPLGAGGGMEYPMVTNITSGGSAKSLDNVITHEVGHNWFYGMLGSNERTHAWMDEGMNSYYEYRYMQTYYAKEGNLDIPAFATGGTPYEVEDLAYHFEACRHTDQACDTHSDGFSALNYYIGAYRKPTMIFRQLQDYLGTEETDAIFQAYFKEWALKHPQPDDFFAIVNRMASKELPWIKDYILTTKNMDYAIDKVSSSSNGYDVAIKNKGNVNASFTIGAMKGDSLVWSEKVAGFEGVKSIQVPAGDYDQISIDPQYQSLDYRGENNHYRTKGLFKMANPLSLRLLTSLPTPEKANINIIPMPAYNVHDGFILGAAFHNYDIITKPWEYLVAPAYGFNSGDVIGMADLRRNIFTEGLFRHIEIGANYRTANYRFSSPTDTSYFSRFQRFAPRLVLNFKRDIAYAKYQKLQFTPVFLWTEQSKFDSVGTFLGQGYRQAIIPQLEYELDNKRSINPYRFNLRLETQAYEDVRGDQRYVRLAAEWNGAYTYKQKKALYYRLFFGGLPYNSAKSRGNIFPGAFYRSGEASADYAFNDFYFGRNNNEGLARRMVLIRDGGMRNALGSSFTSTAGNSNVFMIAANFNLDLPEDLPLKLPVKPYFDIVYSENGQPLGASDGFVDQLWWSGGVSLNFGKGLFMINFPLYSSSNIRDLYDAAGQTKYLDKITFTLDLKKANPVRILEKISLQ